MKKTSFRLSAVALSVLFGFSATAVAAPSSVAVPDVSKLTTGTDGQYTGGGSVFIGGSDLAWTKDHGAGSGWQRINTRTAGFDALVRSSGYLDYLNGNSATLASDPNYMIWEGFQRDVHGQRLAINGNENGFSHPVNVVQGLRMGTADNRYQKVQEVTLYQRDASGNIQYQKDAKDEYVLDTKGNRIPLTVSSTIVLDRNSDVYMRPVVETGGEFGLVDAAIYSKVKSFAGDVAAAVTSEGALRENGWANHGRDVLVVKDSIIDNTLAEDAWRTTPSDERAENEHHYSERPFAVGLSVAHSSVEQQLDSEGRPVNAETLTHRVPANPNVVLENVQITAQNLAAVREDNHEWRNDRNYDKYADRDSTALSVAGSGLFTTIGNSTLTGGVNGAGKSLVMSGHANRTDIHDSTLNGDVTIAHDGYAPTITIAVSRDDKGNYVAVGANAGYGDGSVLRRDRNGTALNVANSTINGDILASGVTGYEVQLVDVTDKNAQTDITPNVHPTAQAIYNNAVRSYAQQMINNADNAYTPVAVSLDHSVLNGRVSGTTAVDNPHAYGHDSNARVLNWNPDLAVKNGSVWNAAADYKEGDGSEFPVSNLHDLNLSASTLNLVNLSTDTATLGDKHRYQSLRTARVVVHNNLTQDKDANGNYLGSTINVGRGVVEPLLNIGGDYLWGSLQVKGSAQGNYWLNIASSGIEPLVKNGYLADNDSDEEKGHSFVNYKNANSDVHFNGKTELGVYQYVVADDYDDRIHDEHNVYFKRNGKLSNSAATALSMPAAQANIATLEADTLAKHLNASQHAKDDGGVWLAYYGGKNKNTVDAGAEYNLKTSGVMLGVDNRFDSAKGGSWLAGVAFSSARSDLSVMNSSGDLDSYGAQFYLSRRFDNGVFVDTQAQFNHFSNSASVHMLGGGNGHADYSGNGYGLGMTVGYTWQQQGYFVEPYLKATGRTFDAASYSLSNGMVVNGNDYKSMLGELGANLGYTFEIDQGYIKPYLHLAGLNEFADSNTVRINNVNLNNSIDGAAFQLGAGAEMKLFKDFGGYAAFDYTKGSDIERPWQATVGVNYSW